MRTLRDLYAYNAWANVRVFAACRDADGAQLAAAAPGTFGSIHETLTHMVGVENAAESFYDEPLHVPWFDFPLTRHDGFLQVVSHSAQHRAQVFSVLGERRQQVPDLDYVLFVQSQRGDH